MSPGPKEQINKNHKTDKKGRRPKMITYLSKLLVGSRQYCRQCHDFRHSRRWLLWLQWLQRRQLPHPLLRHLAAEVANAAEAEAGTVTDSDSMELLMELRPNKLNKLKLNRYPTSDVRPLYTRL
jgi:hypothetical protein